MCNKQANITLNNGVQMPLVGIGTFLLSPADAEASCISALKDGYRLIDTANAYVNVEKTLDRLDTEYIDLLLIHQPAGNYRVGYKLMEKAYKEGKVKAIGLSNFNKEQVREILDVCEVKPAVLEKM